MQFSTVHALNIRFILFGSCKENTIQNMINLLKSSLLRNIADLLENVVNL